MTAKAEPYRVWHLSAPFTKTGFPVMGNRGASIEPVIVMRSDTFKRLCREVPGMAEATFEIGQYDDE